MDRSGDGDGFNEFRVLFGEVNVKPGFKSDSVAIISSRYIVDLDNLRYAALKAVENWKRGYRISKSVALEILLYHSATRQIRDAVKTAARGKERAGLVVLDENEFEKIRGEIGFKESNFIPEYDVEEIKRMYNVTDEELEIVGIERLNLLVRERIALFSVSRDVR